MLETKKNKGMHELVNTHSPWIADWMPALEDRRHAERWK